MQSSIAFTSVLTTVLAASAVSAMNMTNTTTVAPSNNAVSGSIIDYTVVGVAAIGAITYLL